MSSSAAALKLLDLIYSHRVTAVIYVAAVEATRLGVSRLTLHFTRHQRAAAAGQARAAPDGAGVPGAVLRARAAVS